MKNYILWGAAVVITLSAAVFQRLTGPTHPKSIAVTLSNSSIKSKLPRSGTTGKVTPIILPLPASTNATLYYKRYKTTDKYSAITFSPKEDKLVALLPEMPPAAKLQYYIKIRDNSQTVFQSEPVVLRYKGKVPAWALIPHILLMFGAMLYSNVAGISALYRSKSHKRYGVATLLLLLAGGLIFGPIVQHYAFGQAWSGFPVGYDLTDNKTLIAFVFWLFAVILNRKKNIPIATLVAALVTLAIYVIPHSTKGSELDYKTGRVTTGYLHTRFIHPFKKPIA